MLVLSLAVPQLVAQQEDNASVTTNSVLQWVDSEPSMGQELALDSSITLYFDRPLDCNTVQDAFRIRPAIEGSLACDGASLTFTPNTAFDRANTYVVLLDTKIRAADGAQLLQEIQYQVDTVGFVQISETFPSPDSEGIELDITLTIIFNRPIVPLTLLEERDTLPSPITISPSVAGQGEWLNTSIYVFKPDENLQAAAYYTVTVESGLSSVDGAILPDDYVFNFYTQLPSIVEFSPTENQYNVSLDTSLQVRFNQVMKQTVVEKYFFLQTFESTESVSGSFEWADDGMGFRFTPDEKLQLATTYVAGFTDEGFNDTASDIIHLAGTVIWMFDTVPYPAIIDTSPENGQEDVYPSGGVVIYFDSPMNEETLADKITIDPEPQFEPRFYYRDWSDSYEVSFQPWIGATHTITIAPGAEDIYGNRIEEEYTFSYTTGDLDPEVSLRVPAPIGFYNARREPTQVFVTYRNIDSFSISLHDVPLDQFSEFVLNPDNYLYDLSYSFQALPDTRIASWTVDGTQVPRNALRFDLLEFDDTIGTYSCGNSLPSQLQLGDRPLVITEPDPIRARSAPVDGEIVDLLYRDYALTILAGPVCGEDGLLWWKVQLRDETSAWVAESVGDEYLIAPAEPDGIEAISVANQDGTALAPGLYYIQIDSEEFYQQSHIMIVGTANLVVKHTLDSMMVWATDVQTGLPIANAPITIYEEGFRQVAQGTSDSDGILYLKVPELAGYYQRRLAVLNDGENFGLGFSDWSDGIDPYQFGQSYNYFPSPYRIYVYSDRPVYRPGQPVYIRGIVREQDDMDYTPPSNDRVHVMVRDDRGDMIYEGYELLSDYGTWDLKLDLDQDAPLGYYWVSAEMPGRSQYDYPSGGVSFSVAEYRLPEFLVDVIPELEQVVQGDTVRVTIDSTYFFGGAVSDAEVTYSVISENYFFNYDGPGYYDFTDYNYDAGPSAYYATSSRGTIASGVDQTNDDGEFTVEIPADLGDASQSQNFIIEAVVRDETGQVVAGRASVTVHQGEIYLGTRPESYVSRVDEESIVNIIAVDWDSEAVANQQIDVEVVERRWSSVQERDENGRTVWTWDVEEIPVNDGRVTSDASGNAQFTFTPPRGGTYKITVVSRDGRGNEIRSSTFMWVSSYQYVSWRQQNSNRIDLISDHDDYKVGDTANILITSPFQGTVEALVTVERGDVLFTDRITMDSNSYLYQLPITEDYAPNIYVSVMIVKGVDETNPVAGFRMGYIQFAVDAHHRVISIDITSDLDRASPQQTVTYTLRTSNWQGNPVSAEVGVAVTDLAALSLADPNSGPIFNYFFSEQALSVRTATALTINTDQITQEVIDTVKGGGGGILTEGIIEIRGEFIDTPYWNAHLVTDAKGEATFEVRLPDNLTTWRLDARAVTLAQDGDLLVGQDTFDLLSTKPLIVRPVTPRFFVVGDEVMLSAVVNNNTDAEQDLVVTINVDAGVTLHDERAQQVTIPADGRARVTWRATIENVKTTRMSFMADAGNFSDGSIPSVSLDDEGTLPVYRYEAPETVGTAGVLSSSESRVETIYLPERLQGTLTIQVDQSLAATTLDGLEYLQNYPHQCTEQTVSRFLPNIMSFRALEQFGLSDPGLEAGLLRNVNFGLQKLYAEQHADGGWGWFVRSESNTTVTAYVLLGLAEAREQGFPVPDRVLTQAQEYLRLNFEAPTTNQSYWRANRQAFMLYAMARSGAPDVGRASAMFQYRDNLSIYGRALLAETFWYIDPVDTSRSDVLLDDIMNRAITSAAGVHWEEHDYDYWNWNTNTRTTALVLSAFVKLRPTSDLVPNVVRYLMIQRKADAWETTQETAWAVMALTDWMSISGELNADYAYDVSFNADTRVSGLATLDTVRDRNVLFVDVSEMLKGEANRLVFTRTGSNDGNMYYTAYLTAYLPVPQIEPINNGIIVDRRYVMPNDETETTITEARVGELVQVRLSIIVPNSLHYVVVTDPLPAGTEGIDPNLNTSQQIGTRPGLDSSSLLRYGWGWWWFGQIEFHDEAVYLYADYLPAGTYEYVYTIRAGVEGTYNVIPPTAQEFYFPDIYGRGAGSLFTVLPAEG
jgi:hypothetical protein